MLCCMLFLLEKASVSFGEVVYLLVAIVADVCHRSYKHGRYTWRWLVWCGGPAFDQGLPGTAASHISTQSSHQLPGNCPAILKCVI